MTYFIFVTQTLFSRTKVYHVYKLNTPFTNMPTRRKHLLKLAQGRVKLVTAVKLTVDMLTGVNRSEFRQLLSGVCCYM